ncbi:exodeoxyribonuclease V subunit beta [Thalassolituus sp. LLYu03]|uniref:exodeoxyribonuclease V subunit beta n=1 Tax=Thalassolituus sp. LLYu03 TaxID=3421656 RepID=UPI003D2C002D
MQTLSVHDFPLAGQSLIEASAGTGKTYTIAGLYNRLILGHGRGGERLGCDQILVVTFTRAATEELRGRIRQRLRDSFEDILRLENNQKAHDSAFYACLSDLAAQAGCDAAVIRQGVKPWLQANLALMDEAAIFTIHGFCQRMLKQFAFDSGVVFSAELVLDADTYLQQACEDIWRREAYPLSAEQSRFLLSRYSGPDQLLAKVKSRIARPDVKVLPVVPADSFDALWAQAASQFQRIRALCADTPAADLVQLIAASGVSKRSYNSKNTPNWVGQVYRYFSGEFQLPEADNLSRLTYEVMEEKLEKGDLPSHALFDAFSAFSKLAGQLSLLLDLAWQDAISARYFELLEHAGALTPDDLLRLLQAALRSVQGEALATQIRRLYPVAMIDEFQDTDPQQYEIFNRIYPARMPEQSKQPVDPDRPGCSDYALIMIGDPKQAIYGFRGADIFTYITARRQLADSQRFTLSTNWRSHTRLVSGVNELFAANTSPFIFDDDIEFIKVSAGGSHDNKAFQVGGVEQTPLQLWHDGEEYSRPAAQRTAASQCAAQIAALMQGAGRLGENSVQARDIAVLVRSRRQAGWVREALAAEGIGSVFLTRDSVFETQEALDTFRWLQAIAHPADERTLRSALATETQGYSAHQLDQFLNDESAWEDVLSRHQLYHQLWNRRGVMAAVMQWLEDDGRAERLRALADGERRLTNLMHLGELLQSASRRLRGHEALLRWLGEHVFSEQHAGDEAQLRLESDANLVTIVTIHKSKGLQYPLVFLPYLWDDQTTNAKADVQYFSDKDGGMVLNLRPDDEAKAQAARDALAESLRLLYVALTRAEQGCFVWLMDALDGRSKNQKKSIIAASALGYLLGLDTDPDWQGLKDNAHADIAVSAPADWTSCVSVNTKPSQNLPSLAAELFSGRARDLWRVSSYSQLTQEHDGGAVTVAAAESLNADDELLRGDEMATGASATDYSVVNTLASDEAQAFDELHPALTFAKGANAGTCLHAVFEHWDFRDAQKLADIGARELSHYGLLAASDSEQAAQIQALSQWLTAVVQSPLMDARQARFCLADIGAGNRLDEMEFYLPVANLRPHQIDTLLASPAGRHGRFHFDPLSGYLKGFIDLIFCHDGRYYVADYKSNHLGFTLADYAPASLQNAMLDHSYDLQAWIYTLALDQLLKHRLPDYQPQQHLGGVYYFFLRGMHLGKGAPLFSLTAPGAAQGDLFNSVHYELPPGVYYHAIDEEQLARWRQVFFEEASV